MLANASQGIEVDNADIMMYAREEHFAVEVSGPDCGEYSNASEALDASDEECADVLAAAGM